MKIIKLSKDNFNKTVDLVKVTLENNGLVVLPSDTAYGLAANACSAKAVQRIYDFKGRQFGKGLSIFLNNFSEIGQYTIYSHHQEVTIKTLLPGPFTVILESRGLVSPQVEPGDKTLGIRIIDHQLIKAVTQSVAFPITATSANLAGKGPHFSIDSFLKTLSVKKKKEIDLIVDAGQLPRRPTSTLVRLVDDKIKVLRQGILNLELLLEKETQSESETKEIAQKIFREYLNKDLSNTAVVLVMKGSLGAGKTVFAKGIGELFGLELTSPTFVLMDEHLVKTKKEKLKTKNIFNAKILYHLDLYRIESEEEILELNLSQFLKKGNLMMIEWGEKLSVFEKLKTDKTVFYLMQIEETGRNKRKFSFFKV
ncbi:L-threonylcarbamoyladenylate synthase [Patescibacteria group bacterium]